MLDRLGDSITNTGFTMPRRRHTCCRVVLVAVAVRAIILTFWGTRLLASPIARNSFRNVSPLVEETRESGPVPSQHRLGLAAVVWDGGQDSQVPVSGSAGIHWEAGRPPSLPQWCPHPILC